MFTIEQYNNDNDLIQKAISFAFQKHSGQVRKGTSIPYIVHPIEVWQILRNNNCSVNVQIAGLLHDTLEDTNTTEEEIKELFGNEILSLVKNESEDKSKTWKERKQATINHLSQTKNKDILCIACADKLSNCRSQLYDYKQIGKAVFDRFNSQSTPHLQAWYYKSLVQALSLLKGFKMYEDLCQTVKELYK